MIGSVELVGKGYGAMGKGRPLVERVTMACSACGTEVVRRKSDVERRSKSRRVFCDRQCTKAMGNKPRLAERVTLTCAGCGADVVRRKRDVERTKPGKVFCNRQCTRMKGTKPRTGELRSCKWCEGEMYVPLSVATRQRFCSKACYDSWQRRDSALSTCEQCGIAFQRAGTAGRGQRFCSRTCMGLGKIKRPLQREHNGKPARLNTFGYVWLWEPDHPSAHAGWMAEHRLVAEGMIGRRLTPDDEVNHINRIRHDNRPENLEVLDSFAHSKVTARQRKSDHDLLAEYIARFGPL